MKNKTSKVKKPRPDDIQDDDLYGYPPYPPTEDIYGVYQKDRDINPEDPSNLNSPKNYNKPGLNNEKDFEEDMSGSDLDVPGSELDDDLEFIGSEDEENNYYSLGGDDHNDLDEDYIE